MVANLCNEKILSRNDIAAIETPRGTKTWKPVPHIDFLDGMTKFTEHYNWGIESEHLEITCGGKRFFGRFDMRKSASPDWKRSIGFRNSHDKSFAVGISAGINVIVCSNMAFGGEISLRHKHTSQFHLFAFFREVYYELNSNFNIIENTCLALKKQAISSDDEVRLCIFRALELKAINPTDVISVLREYQHPQHEEFRPRTRWSLLNSFTEVIKRYKPDRREIANDAINSAFGLNGENPLLWSSHTDFNREYLALDERRRQKELELADIDKGTEQ